ncbi:MAG: MBL fold metallo-hydrolase [Elusimicrobia bacterium]|nr:MBL fold metallo-hydrolase [Elusimicrobiota bacterium]
MNKSGFSVQKVVVGYFETNCYIIFEKSSKKAFIIDPGADADLIIGKVSSLNLMPKGIINTHGHIDHTGANSEIKSSYNIPVYIHKDDEKFLYDSSLNGSVFFGEDKKLPKADVILSDSEIIKESPFEFKVIHTPGHTPGGICLVIEDIIFTGDTLFKGSVGRWDLPGGSEKELKNSLKILNKFPKEMIVFPGHGPESTLKEEFDTNPYLIK